MQDEKPVLRKAPAPAGEAPCAPLPAWKLEEAKAKFSEVVRRARAEGPQRVTYRGADAVVVLAVDEYERLVKHAPRPPNLVEFLQGLGFPDIDLHRSRDGGRDIDL